MIFRWKKLDYTTPAGAAGGPGIQKQFPWYAAPFIDITVANYPTAAAALGLTLGDAWWLSGQSPASGGNAFAFVKATVGLSLGQLVSTALPTTGTATVPGSGTVASPLTSTASITTNINNAATVAVNGDVDNFLWVSSTGATLPQLRRIKANSSSTTSFYKVALQDFMRPNNPTDQDVLDTIPTNGDAVRIIRPWNVIVNTATTVPVGVALGTVTAGSYTIIQLAGLATILTDGTVNTVVNVPAVGIAGGLIGGFAGTATALTGTAANQFSGAGLILPQLAKTGNAAADPLFTPNYINFTGQ